MKKPDCPKYMLRRVATLDHFHWEVFNQKGEVVATCRSHEAAQEAVYILMGEEVYHG